MSRPSDKMVHILKHGRGVTFKKAKFSTKVAVLSVALIHLLVVADHGSEAHESRSKDIGAEAVA